MQTSNRYIPVIVLPSALHLPVISDFAVILSAAKDPENSNSPLLIDPFKPDASHLSMSAPEESENKHQKVGKLPALQISAFSHHVSPSIHHDFTIKKPRSAPHFSQKPLQKPPPPPQHFFLPLP